MEETIIAILKELNPYVEINAETKLIEEEVLDSLSILLLIDELEKEYGIEIPLDGLKIEDFQTIFSISDMINRLR